MNIAGIGSSPTHFYMGQAPATTQAGEGGAQSLAGMLASPTENVGTPGSMLAGNFVQSGEQTSRYLKGMMMGFEVQNQYKNTMSSMIETYQIQASVDPGSYASRTLAGQKAARAVEQMGDREVAKSATERMEGERKDDAERAARRREAPAQPEGAPNANAKKAGDAPKAETPSLDVVV